jgi:hypothetical protein
VVGASGVQVGEWSWWAPAMVGGCAAPGFLGCRAWLVVVVIVVWSVKPGSMASGCEW